MSQHMAAMAGWGRQATHSSCAWGVSFSRFLPSLVKSESQLLAGRDSASALQVSSTPPGTWLGCTSSGSFSSASSSSSAALWGSLSGSR